MATPLTKDFAAFLRSFASNRVEYLLVGGLAVSHYGYPRPTGDADTWVRDDPDNAARIVSALVEFGFGVAELEPELFMGPNLLVRMGYPPSRIKIMTSVSGVTFEECWPSRVEDTWDGVPLIVISLDCLKKNKLASGRLKDLADLEQLP